MADASAETQLESPIRPPLVPPGEVGNVQFDADTVSVRWDPVPGAAPVTVYDAARGLVGELPAGSGFGRFARQAVGDLEDGTQRGVRVLAAGEVLGGLADGLVAE